MPGGHFTLNGGLTLKKWRAVVLDKKLQFIETELNRFSHVRFTFSLTTWPNAMADKWTALFPPQDVIKSCMARLLCLGLSNDLAAAAMRHLVNQLPKPLPFDGNLKTLSFTFATDDRPLVEVDGHWHSFEERVHCAMCTAGDALLEVLCRNVDKSLTFDGPMRK